MRHRWTIRRAMAACAALSLVLLLTLPLLALAIRAVPHLGSLDNREQDVVSTAIWLSLRTSIVSLAIILITGIPLSYLLARHQFRGRAILETLIDLPMILPPAVAGLALLMAFGRRGLLGQYLDAWGIQIGFSTTAVVIAQIFVSSPFFVRSATAAFARIPREQEEIAADLGAPPFAVLRTITIPLAAPGLAAGAVLAWARAIGEFGATIMFAGSLPGITQTLPLAIYGRYEAGGLNTALVMAVILLGSSFLVLLSVRSLGGKVPSPFGR